MSVGKLARGGDKNRPSRKAFDFLKVETHGRSATALVVEAGKTNEHSILEETIATHLVPRKSTTTRSLMRLLPRKIEESIDLKFKQAEKIDVWICKKGHETIEQSMLVRGRWCGQCNSTVELTKKLTGRMIEGTYTKVLSLSPTSLLDRTKNFQQVRLFEKGTNFENKDFATREKDIDYPTAEVKAENNQDQPNEITLDAKEKYLLGYE